MTQEQQSLMDSFLSLQSTQSTSVLCEQMNELMESGEVPEEVVDELLESANNKDSTVLRDKLYPIVAKTLADKNHQKQYKEQIDRYMAKNVQSYSTIGPSTRPMLPSCLAIMC